MTKPALTSFAVARELASTSIKSVPLNLLETFVPGYSLISKILSEVLGFDITVAVSSLFVLFACGKAVSYLYRQAFFWAQRYCMCGVTIEADTDIYDAVLDWLMLHKVSRHARWLIAAPEHGSQRGSRRTRLQILAGAGMDEADYLPGENKVRNHYTPSWGSYYFIEQRRLFRIDRSRSGGDRMGSPLAESINVLCLGQSTAPIKRLIEDCQRIFQKNTASSTIIRRPSPKQQRHMGNSWNRLAIRSSRSIDTIVLDAGQKYLVVDDIKDYVSKETRRWYADRGIPYRRGYLFFGPAGTGKTSFAFALAGHFKTEIYCISLLDPSISEEDLHMFFSSLPRRCIVLLEDVDTAGLDKREIAKGSRGWQESLDAPPSFPPQQPLATGLSPGGISLSGLLNAIDGVSSHEGRVLIMTTNQRSKLDNALLRPGRVDLQVEFKNATREQMAELFVRMYTMQSSSSSPSSALHSANAGTAPTVSSTADASADASAAADKQPNLSADLASMGRQFAELLPPDVFSPAEIQGFLLTKKMEPEKALAEVEAWREETIKAKERSDD